MHSLDWIILFATLVGISAYGIWKSRGGNTKEAYLASNRDTPWWAIGLSIMATQASAITFISTPGLGYESGLEFAQFYLGLPIAMIIIAVAFVPLYHRLKVFTAYEFLESRFNLNARLLTAFLFLVQRGLAAGITIYAPSIILSQILGLPLYINILVIGILVIIYTVSGGTKAVTQTHKQQMAVIFLGLFVAFGFLWYYIRQDVSSSELWALANTNNRLDLLNFEFNLREKYNVWSGVLAGTFLMLSYFGTDQSQVQRYLSGKSIKEIRTGLYFNAVLKIPMQIFILFLGVLVFVFYKTHQPPTHFDQQAVEHVMNVGSSHEKDFLELKQEKEDAFNYQADLIKNDFSRYQNEEAEINAEMARIDNALQDVIHHSGYSAQVEKESDFVFITFVLDHLPIGLIGLLMAVIFSAAMSSTAAELNALGTTSVIDFYTRLTPETKQRNTVLMSRLITAGWGVLAISFALVAQFFDSLVEAVNILGSLFYGTVLGIFLIAFYLKKITGNSVVWGAILSEILVLVLYFFADELGSFLHIDLNIGFLWFNVIGAALTISFAFVIQLLRPSNK
jgi:Na+/proline symporter